MSRIVPGFTLHRPSHPRQPKLRAEGSSSRAKAPLRKGWERDILIDRSTGFSRRPRGAARVSHVFDRGLFSMMQSMRDNMKVIIWVTAIVFLVGFGILQLGGVLNPPSGSGPAGVIAKINGEPIRYEDF